MGRFGSQRRVAQEGYARLVAEGVGQGSIWGLGHQLFLGSDRFIERFGSAAGPAARLREVPRAQRRRFARPISYCARIYPDRREAMVRALPRALSGYSPFLKRTGVKQLCEAGLRTPT